MKCYFNPGHNLSHYLIVIILRLDFLLLSLVPSFSLIIIGLTLSIKVIRELLPYKTLLLFDSYLIKLPYRLEIDKFLVTQFGKWYLNSPSWWAIVIGAPFIIIGVDIFLINLLNFFLSITNRVYGQSHCPFCKNFLEINGFCQKEVLK